MESPECSVVVRGLPQLSPFSVAGVFGRLKVMDVQIMTNDVYLVRFANKFNAAQAVLNFHKSLFDNEVIEVSDLAHPSHLLSLCASMCDLGGDLLTGSREALG